ncbi:MAG TPA: cupin domain-containing protein [Caulobacteraceae bacterium]|jgi:mannose-6-phosphate isomerase-like protein (cupin superfamily)|nr:cupin domain-containing protein [Caulobacteraceae bacterium]
MRTFGLGVVALLAMAATAVAQAPPAAPAPPPLKTFAGSAEIAAMIAKAKSQQKPDVPTIVMPIVGLLPYVANLEYRTGVGPATTHEIQAEIFYVLDGSGTLVTGGKLAGETRTNPENLRGVGIDGGVSRTVVKGDMVIVPENTPHWFNKFNGPLVLISLKVPHQSGNPK